MDLKSMLNVCHCLQAEELTAALLVCRETDTTVSGLHYQLRGFNMTPQFVFCGLTLQVTDFFANRSRYLPEALLSLSQHTGSLTTGFLAHSL